MIVKDYYVNGKKYQVKMETECEGVAKIVTVRVYETIKLFLYKLIYENIHYLSDFGSYDTLAKYCIVSTITPHIMNKTIRINK